ncbi:hypothetical protein [Hafnia paralvei]|uniref:hypothetical protein n=1 Tax=Hafnia paralvei TaxID=546367 RepID=UPI003C2E8D09
MLLIRFIDRTDRFFSPNLSTTGSMIVVAGVLLEEAVEKLIAGVPFLTPIASIITAVLVVV